MSLIVSVSSDLNGYSGTALSEILSSLVIEDKNTVLVKFDEMIVQASMYRMALLGSVTSRFTITKPAGSSPTSSVRFTVAEDIQPGETVTFQYPYYDDLEDRFIGTGNLADHTANSGNVWTGGAAAFTLTTAGWGGYVTSNGAAGYNITAVGKVIKTITTWVKVSSKTTATVTAVIMNRATDADNTWQFGMNVNGTTGENKISWRKRESAATDFGTTVTISNHVSEVSRAVNFSGNKWIKVIIEDDGTNQRAYLADYPEYEVNTEDDTWDGSGLTYNNSVENVGLQAVNADTVLDYQVATMIVQ